MNGKYEITDIAHDKYPWLHRIRASMDIGEHVKEGDLGGFVESESNLSFEPGDEAWLFGDSVCCGEAHICKGAILRDAAMAKDRVYISHDAVLSGSSSAEDDAIVRGASLSENARVSGCGMLIQSSETGYRPEAAGKAAIYGKVIGNYFLTGETVIFPGEEFHNDCRDRLWIYDNKRTVQRETSRGELKPRTRQQKRRDHIR